MLAPFFMRLAFVLLRGFGLTATASLIRQPPLFPGARVAAKEAIDKINSDYYNVLDGRWSTPDAWWVNANIFADLAEFSRKTLDLENLPRLRRTFKLQRGPLPWWKEGGGDFRADSTDDTAWWAMAMIRMYDLTGHEKYLDVAKIDEEYIYKYWTNDTCGGGILWSIRNLSYKNAISNELYILLAASLHNRIGNDEMYLSRALQSWDWFNSTGMINSASRINDGLEEKADGTCINNNYPEWTYNQGIILGALVELQEATDDDKYLETAKKIADATLSSPTFNVDGVLTERCEADHSCDGNQQSFKGLFMRELMVLNKALGNDPYRAFVRRNAVVAWERDRDSSGAYDVTWGGPFNSSTMAEQSSVVSMLVALVR